MILGCVNNVIIIIFGCIIPLKWYPLLISHSQVILVFNLDWKHVTSDYLLFSCIGVWIMASVLQYWVWTIKPRAIRNDVLVVYLCTVWSARERARLRHMSVFHGLVKQEHFTVIHVNVVQNNFYINKLMSFRWTGARFCFTENSGTKHWTSSLKVTWVRIISERTHLIRSSQISIQTRPLFDWQVCL